MEATDLRSASHRITWSLPLSTLLSLACHAYNDDKILSQQLHTYNESVKRGQIIELSCLWRIIPEVK